MALLVVVGGLRGGVVVSIRLKVEVFWRTKVVQKKGKRVREGWVDKAVLFSWGLEG